MVRSWEFIGLSTSGEELTRGEDDLSLLREPQGSHLSIQRIWSSSALLRSLSAKRAGPRLFYCWTLTTLVRPKQEHMAEEESPRTDLLSAAATDAQPERELEHLTCQEFPTTVVPLKALPQQDTAIHCGHMHQL